MMVRHLMYEKIEHVQCGNYHVMAVGSTGIGGENENENENEKENESNKSNRRNMNKKNLFVWGYDDEGQLTGLCHCYRCPIVNKQMKDRIVTCIYEVHCVKLSKQMQEAESMEVCLGHNRSMVILDESL